MFVDRYFEEAEKCHYEKKNLISLLNESFKWYDYCSLGTFKEYADRNMSNELKQYYKNYHDDLAKIRLEAKAKLTEEEKRALGLS